MAALSVSNPAFACRAHLGVPGRLLLAALLLLGVSQQPPLLQLALALSSGLCPPSACHDTVAALLPAGSMTTAHLR